MKSSKTFSNLVKNLNANFFYNSKLRITASSENYRRLINFYFDIAGSNNEKYRELNISTKPIIIFPKLRINFLEKVCNYRRFE